MIHPKKAITQSGSELTGFDTKERKKSVGLNAAQAGHAVA